MNQNKSQVKKKSKVWPGTEYLQWIANDFQLLSVQPLEILREAFSNAAMFRLECVYVI